MSNETYLKTAHVTGISGIFKTILVTLEKKLEITSEMKSNKKNKIIRVNPKRKKKTIPKNI